MANEITKDIVLSTFANFKCDGKEAYAGTKKLTDAMLETLITAQGWDITPTELKTLFKEEREDDIGETVFVSIPLRETFGDSDLNDADHLVWQDVKFVRGDNDTFYVKDSDVANTYTRILSSATTSDTSDAKILRDAFNESSDAPEKRFKRFAKTLTLRDIDKLPTTALNYVKIKARKYDKRVIWQKLYIPTGSVVKLYEGFIGLEGDFRRSGQHYINRLKNLTNDPNEAALCYIDLDAIPSDKHSDLWDNFLLERFHSPEYVSIFKAWIYSIAIGKNNSRQIMWLYGNGGTGKGCMCQAIIRGFNKLAGKDICLAASKDTGKSNFNSEILNKHLMVYSDAKNLKSSMSEFFHNITGGDYIRIEGKCKEAISAQIYMKCLVCANDRPQCDMTDRSQSSRFILMPFTLSDDEMKEMNLMDEYGQIKGSSDFMTRLENEFMDFLGSCREHYVNRCKTNSNIDAHEAREELETINLDSIRTLEEFIDEFYEITDDPKDRLTQKDFRISVLAKTEYATDEGIKPYKEITFTAVKDFLQKKYNFEWKQKKINGDNIRAVASDKFGIKIKNSDNNVSPRTYTQEEVENENLNF